jgi:hypothetical protein
MKVLGIGNRHWSEQCEHAVGGVEREKKRGKKMRKQRRRQLWE